MKGNLKKRIIKSLLILAVTFGFISFNHVTTYAAAATSETTATVGSYTIKVPVGAEIPAADGSTTVTPITSSITSLNGGWYVVDQDVSLTSKLTLNGDVNIILCDGKKLTVNSTSVIAIEGSRYNVTIWGQTAGTGEMVAQSEPKNAIEVNSITINGGKLTASGYGGIVTNSDFIINAGTVEATGTNNNGIYAHGSFTMNNGTVTASGNNGIAAVADFTINAGTVEATGSGHNGINVTASFTMNNGIVTASGYIGINTSDDFTINAGTIEATGNNKYGIVTNSAFTMNNGTVTATGSESGIRAWGAVTVDGGTIRATGTGESGFWAGDLFTINNGTITANGNYYGISCRNEDLIINGGTVEARAFGTSGYDFECIYIYYMDSGKTITIADSAKVYAGDAAPGSLFTGSDYSLLSGYRYASIVFPQAADQAEGNQASVDGSSGEDVIQVVTVPAVQSTNVAGVKLENWDAVEKAIKTVGASNLQKVTDASDSMLQVSIIGSSDKIVPVAIVNSLKDANFRYFHVYIGSGDAVTFDTKVDNSKYVGISFGHTDTVTKNSKIIDFELKGPIGTKVIFHTSIPASNTSVNIYRMEDGKKVWLTSTKSNENGKLCFTIDRTARYILEY